MLLCEMLNGAIETMLTFRAINLEAVLVARELGSG